MSVPPSVTGSATLWGRGRAASRAVRASVAQLGSPLGPPSRSFWGSWAVSPLLSLPCPPLFWPLLGRLARRVAQPQALWVSNPLETQNAWEQPEPHGGRGENSDCRLYHTLCGVLCSQVWRLKRAAQHSQCALKFGLRTNLKHKMHLSCMPVSWFPSSPSYCLRGWGSVGSRKFAVGACRAQPQALWVSNPLETQNAWEQPEPQGVGAHTSADHR